MTEPSVLDLDEAVAGAVRAVLLTRYPEAQHDPAGMVATAGFSSGPGAPGRAQARVVHHTRFPGVLSGLTFADAEAEVHVFASAYADLLRQLGWSVREIHYNQRLSLLVSSPACPECSGPTLPLTVQGEDIWRCPACGRRTYGTGDEDDVDLPSYTETEPDGTVFIYHGNGEVDLEATAELASQDGPDPDDEDAY
ncbi:zf-TFIIB domain-containing protein [Kitasatospora sp. GP82]|uniref:TFIIB-type zinc ribbon-containing protein n=1 Tax=Kitasatospora sp. GP82 TaxID=3035089 RepID=UPI0024764D06|nr:zf-TFIIB domain-containing protein [Kitasatospora sp. GP82]MDH6129407.1 ribosomal protein L37AE/L43A [Kitasatospora sp. GP82]